jgi:hypothetical protein
MKLGVRRGNRTISIAILLIAVIASIFMLAAKSAHAAPGINQQMNFQGRLLNAQGATVPDGYYNVQFKIYQDGDGLTAGNTTGSPAGTLKWTENHLNASGKGVQVKNGFMSVELGSVTPFGTSIDWNQDMIWLSMNIGSTNASCTPFANCSPDGEMTPMKRLSSTPFSLNSNLLGGLASSQFVQFAQGVQTDAATNSNSVFINKTSTGNFLALQSAGTDVFLLNNSGDVSFGGNTNHTISVAAAPAGEAGKNLTVSAGSAANIGTGAGGGDLIVQGGNAGGTGNNNGGNIFLTGGTATGTGTKGLVNLGASAYIASTNAGCATNCTIDQSNVDNYGTVIVSASSPSVVMTLPDPTNVATVGRIIYITTANGSQDYVLTTNSGASVINVAMRQNTTATMIWNGTDWTPGGASNATTLQATYNNGTNPTTTPEIKLDSTRNTIDIQDADTSIGNDILNIRGSNASGLGTVLFGVSNTGRVTIQGTSDEYSAFRVLNSVGDYQFNINSSNGYVISNSIKATGNDVVNPSFETGGSTIGGEEGWFGPVQSSIVASNANTGNNSLQVTANTADMDVYAGTYFEVKPGDSLYLQGYVKNSVGANGTAGVQIKWYNKDKGLISADTDYAGLPGTTYVLRKVSATAPAGAVYARVSATVRASATTGTFYFDDFILRKNVESADYTFRNSVDSTAAFRIQSAQSAQTLFTANTTDNILKVGDSTGSDTQTTLLVLDNTTSNPSTSLASKNGGLFYRSDTNSLKAVIGGAIVDICTTAVTCSGYSASASSSIQLQGSTPGTAQVGHFNITGTGILTQLQTQDQSANATNSSTLTIRTGNATGTGSTSGNLVLDTGTGTSGRGSITIGSSGVSVTMGGALSIQGNNSLSLGQASSATGSILFRTAAGTNTVTLKAPGANPTTSFDITLPQNLGNAGDCLKDTGSGVLGFGDCSAGSTTNLQDVYNNSSTPATVTLADGKNLQFNAQDTLTDPSILFNLQCTNSCGSNGRFAIQNNGTDVFTVKPNGGGMVLNGPVQIGSNVTDSTQTNLQLDSYNGSNDSDTCTTSTNQGAMYYNTTMGTIRACINGNWSDISNPEPLGLLSFGVVPASGSQPYDLPALTTTGASGPCKVSYSNATTIAWQACTAYSGGQRISVTAGSVALGTTAFNQWRHLCLTGASGQPALSSASTSATANMPAFSVSAPILCLADIKSASTGSVGNIGQIYDTRTFTSSLKEAVPASTALELGMIADASGTNGALVPAASGSQKLYGLVVATNGSTSTTTPNTIVTTVGPGWIKSTAGTAGQFVKTSLTGGYADTIASIPNNSFYYSAGNTRTSYSATCTASNNCSGSLYVNFIVR